MLKFLHAADLHLDSPLLGLECYEGAPVEQIRGATRRALENLVRLAIEENVACVLIAGDIYDGPWKDFNTGLFFVAQMRRLGEAGIPVFLIAGNHDADNRMTRTLRLPDNVHVFPTDRPGTVRLDDHGLAIHGQGFATAAVKNDLSQAYPAATPGLFNIALLHTAATGREGHEPYAPCTVEGLKQKQYDYWALGHIHTAEVLSAAEEPPIVFPGNVQGRHIRETGPKGCTLVRVDDRGRAQCEFRPLDVLRWELCAVDATGAADLDEVCARVDQELRGVALRCDGLPSAVRVEITGECPAHEGLTGRPQTTISELRALTVGTDIWLEKIKLTTRSRKRAAEWLREEGPLGELLEFVGDLRGDEKQLDALLGGVSEIAELRKKLPAEIGETGELNKLSDTAYLREALSQAAALLSARLSGGQVER